MKRREEKEMYAHATRESIRVCLPIVLTNSKFEINNQIKSLDSIFLSLAHEKSFLRNRFFFRSREYLKEERRKQNKAKQDKTDSITNFEYEWNEYRLDAAPFQFTHSLAEHIQAKPLEQ